MAPYCVRLGTDADNPVVRVYGPGRREPHEYPEQEAARRLLAHECLVEACREAEALIARAGDSRKDAALLAKLRAAIAAAEPATLTGD